jgi:hypothetical protein
VIFLSCYWLVIVTLDYKRNGPASQDTGTRTALHPIFLPTPAAARIRRPSAIDIAIDADIECPAETPRHEQQQQQRSTSY